MYVFYLIMDDCMSLWICKHVSTNLFKMLYQFKVSIGIYVSFTAGQSAPVASNFHYLHYQMQYCCWWDGQPCPYARYSPPACPWQSCSRRRECWSFVLALSSRESTGDEMQERIQQLLSKCEIPEPISWCNKIVITYKF